MFTISIFSSPEEFIALYTSLFDKVDSSVSTLENMMKRTKNPPISIIYTCQLLKKKSIEEYSLDIVRFISQLSDLSDGTSVSHSLQNVIDESSLLTEVRHSLTHKVKVEGYIIQICR